MGDPDFLVFVAISDPANTAALDQIQARTGLIVESIIVEQTVLLQLIEGCKA